MPFWSRKKTAPPEPPVPLEKAEPIPPLETLADSVDAKVVTALTGVVDSRLAQLREGHLNVWKLRLEGSDLRKQLVMATEGTGEYREYQIVGALVMGEVQSLIESLVKWFDDTPHYVHAAFEKAERGKAERDQKESGAGDSWDMLRVFQATSSNNTNYAYLIEASTIRAASETFASAMQMLQRSYPDLSENLLYKLELEWLGKQLLLRDRSYSTLEEERARLRSRGYEKEAMVAFRFGLDQRLSNEVETWIDAFRRTHGRGFLLHLDRGGGFLSEDARKDEAVGQLAALGSAILNVATLCPEPDKLPEATRLALEDVLVAVAMLRLDIAEKGREVADEVTANQKDLVTKWFGPAGAPHDAESQARAELEVSILDSVATLAAAKVETGFDELESSYLAAAERRVKELLGQAGPEPTVA